MESYAKIKLVNIGLVSGGTSMSIDRMTSEHLYIVLVRILNGSTEVHPPFMYLIYMRPEAWFYTLIGEAYDVDHTNILDGVLSITFKSKQWTKMWVYRIDD